MPNIFKDEAGGHGGDLTRALELWCPDGGRIIDFSSNVNPLGPPEGLLEHLKESLPDIVHYPSPQARELREQLSIFLDLSEKRLILGNGANELIHLLVIWKRPRRVFIPAPTFSEYERAANLAEAQVERYSLPPGEAFDPRILAERLGSGDLVVFCNPSNPTGKLFSRQKLLELVLLAEKREAQVMIDESFIPLTGNPETSLRKAGTGNLWIALSLTKLWALPGLRLGCLIGPESGMEKLIRWGDPWRVNTLAQKAGLYCLRQEGYLEKTLKLIDQERRYLTACLMEKGVFKVFAGAANYLLVQGTVRGFDVADFQAELARQGVLIRRADNFHGLDQRFFRVAVLQRRDNNRLVEAIGRYMEKFHAGSPEPSEAGKDETGGFKGGESR